MSHARRLTLALVATCLVAALVGAPTAGAASAGSKSAGPTAKSSVTKKKLARDVRTVKRRSARNRRNIIALSKTLTGLGTELRNAITGGDKTIDDKINGIVNVVTPVLTRLGGGLTELATGVQTLAAATTKGFEDVKAGFGEVEAALTDIGDFLGASKYGIVQIAVPDNLASDPDDANSAPDPVPGCFYVTENMSDEVQPATLAGNCALTGVDPGAQLLFLAGIRSNENDGTGGTDPAGTAGIIAYEQRNATGSLVGGGATPVVSAQTGPTVPIPNESPVTNTAETSFPFGPVSTDQLVNIADAATFQGTPDPPVAAGTGNFIDFTMRFLDLSASADDPNE